MAENTEKQRKRYNICKQAIYISSWFRPPDKKIYQKNNYQFLRKIFLFFSRDKKYQRITGL